MRIASFTRASILPILAITVSACSSPAADSPTDPVEPTVAAATPTSVPTATTVPTPTLEPSATPLVEVAEGRVFAYYGADPSVPVVRRGTGGRWDGKYINPGGVLYHDDVFHMFRNGFTAWPGKVSVGYMTSSDGLVWSEPQSDPVFTSDEVPYVEPGEGADVSSVVVMDDGTWVMYFHRVSNNNPAVIGRATASSPLGPWQVDPEPVLMPGGRGAWDAFGISWPSVVQTEDGLAMYYTGAPSPFEDTEIGLAVSRDGISWTKYDDPATLETRFAESDPVFNPTEAWTTDGVDRARVQPTEDGWAMIYQGGPLVHRGLAFSRDGVHWAPHPDNPVLTSQDFPVSGNMWDTALVVRDGIYYYYTEIGSLAATNIYLAVHEGDLAPANLPEPRPAAALPEGVKILHLDDLLVDDLEATPDYTGYVSSQGLSLGVYAMGVGASDNQPSHGEDEVYYVVEGDAVLNVDGEEVPAQEGAFLFVGADVPHHFEQITADLQTLVYFSKGQEDVEDLPWLAYQIDEIVPSDEPFFEVATMRAHHLEVPPGELRSMLTEGVLEAILLVLSGQGLVHVGEGAARVRPESLIFIPAGLEVAAEAIDDEDLRLLVFEAMK